MMAILLQILLNDRGKFRHGHLETAISHDHPDSASGRAHLDANRAGTQIPWCKAAGMIRSAGRSCLCIAPPTLVLADIGPQSNQRFVFPSQVIDHVRCVKDRIREILMSRTAASLSGIDIISHRCGSTERRGQQFVQNLAEIPDKATSTSRSVISARSISTGIFLRWVIGLRLP